MPIPLAQLQTWANRPDSAASAETYQTVQRAIERYGLGAKYSFDRYLQGSYANATNIRTDSDVDVVVEMESTFHRNLNVLTREEKTRYLAKALPGVHSLAGFKSDVKAALVGYYGTQRVSEGSKCLKVAKNGSRLPIDVLPCQEYRLYTSFPATGQPKYIEGILFETRDGREVVNYPKQHRKNGEAKHSLTNDMYKRVVRVTKNARRKLYEDNLIDKSLSPSYFVECFLYNVPDSVYKTDLAHAYLNSLVWLGRHHSDWADMYCQNGLTRLFGPSPEQWETAKASTLVTKLLQQWMDW